MPTCIQRFGLTRNATGDSEGSTRNHKKQIEEEPGLLKWRLISAAVIVSGLVVLLLLDYRFPLGTAGLWLLPLALVVSQMMVFELLELWRDRPDAPARWPVYLGTFLTVALTCVPLLWPLMGRTYPVGCPVGVLGWPLLGLVVGIAAAFVGQMARYQEPGPSTASIALSVLAISYAGLLFSFLVNLRLYGGSQWGMVALISLVVVVKFSDTGAYFSGRALGRHKMAPRLSPGKTLEGLVGGLVAACLGAWVCHTVLVPRLVSDAHLRGPLWAWLVYGLLLAAAGVMGDLAESLLKRDAGRKDSSSWLPGLGGVLDIVDSIVFAAAPAYFYWALGLIGP
jgi:phosphatidate cytidylyltransferase